MKPIYQSKTFWFNILVMLVMMAEFIGQMRPEWLSFTVLIAGFGNIILRVWFTTEEIKK